jgi:uncharacterized protein (TIGR03663 family)
MTWGARFGLLGALLAALALRCPELARRPMHTDEAVNAMKFRSLLEEGKYRYDPTEYHGPTLLYATLARATVAGPVDFVRLDEAWYRWLTVGIGIGLIVLLGWVADGLGRWGTVGAGLLTAISPAMVFYSRDFIHETLLVFFSFLALASGWRYFRTRHAGWAWLTGASLGLMSATKETFLFVLAAASVALMVNGVWTRWVDPERRRITWKLDFRDGLGGLAAWAIVVVVLFSSFFRNLAGPLDAVRTYLPWLERAAGSSVHAHSWSFYLERLAYYHVDRGPVWSEGLILGLAIVGGIAGFTRRTAADAHAGWVRFCAVYTVTLAAIYSVIAYKTPWCLLGFWHGAILLAGVGAVALVRGMPAKWMKGVTGLLLLGAAGQLACQAWRAAVTDCADRRNPYVYAQTAPDIRELAGELDVLAGVSAEGRQTLVKVMVPGNDYWPLPWYLRAFGRVGWWGELPADPYGPVMIVSTKFGAALDQTAGWVMVGVYQLRPGVFVELYARSDLWKARQRVAGR